ncbi:hypothetical protein [Streptomyces sp. NPDC090445]|uniref:hypothetical protein n=1 Tax=Streptomyces sp. NPDC090445 TaxID=3365963 RepID=UPI003805E84A
MRISIRTSAAPRVVVPAVYDRAEAAAVATNSEDSMTMHRPGRPADLPPAEVLWARWALAAVLTARSEDEGRGVHRIGTWVDGAGLHLDAAAP